MHLAGIGRRVLKPVSITFVVDGAQNLREAIRRESMDLVNLAKYISEANRKRNITIDLLQLPKPNMPVTLQGMPKRWPNRHSRQQRTRISGKRMEIEIEDNAKEIVREDISILVTPSYWM